jgi:LPXTG-motif cell wall-anchored protein
MGTTYQTRTRASQNFYRVFIPILVALSLLASQLVPFAGLMPAEAATVETGVDSGGFQIDGEFNFTEESDTVEGGTRDWSNTPYDTFVDSTSPHQVFTGGSKFGERDDWSITTGNAPGKADILRLYTNFDTENRLLRIAGVRDGSGGDTWVSFELNQDQPDDAYLDMGVPKTPRDGDLLITFGYPGNQSTAAEVIVEEWSGSGWADITSELGEVLAAVNLVNISTDHGTVQQRRFLELSIDVSHLFDSAAGCRSFSESWAYSRSSESGETSQLQDFIAPFPFGFDTCGGVNIQKQSAVDGAGLNDAVFEIDFPDGSTSYCTTETIDGVDGRCEIEDAEPGDYTVTEIAPPPGYRLPIDPDDRTQDHTLDDNEFFTFTFADPPISYKIDVTPDTAINPVSEEHRFLVELWTDFVFDYDAGDHGEIVAESDTPDIPLGGETVEVDWDGPTGSAIERIVDEDGTNTTLTDDPLTCTTLTEDDEDDDLAKEGTCSVYVNSSAIGGPGTLTATYYTPYDGEPAGGNETAGTYADSISDSGTKGWIGYEVELDGDAHNPLGVDHTFTATVWVVGPGDDDREVPDHPVEVTFDWDGPEGSGFKDGIDTCTTAPAGEDDEGTCTVTVTSPDDAGTGTISIIKLDGEIVDGDENLVIDYPTRVEAGEDEEQLAMVVDATKTWWDYRVIAEQDGINPVGEDHPFKVTVQRSSDGETWENVPDGTWLDLDFPSHEGEVGEIVSDECSDPEVGTTDGVCYVVVTSDVPGTGTLTINKIAGTWLDGYDLDDEGKEQAFEFVAGDTAVKDWASYTLQVDPPEATNLLPDHDDHTFTVTLSSDNEGAAPAAGQEIALTLESDVVDAIWVTDGSDADQPVDVEVDEEGLTTFTCTTTDEGTCEVRVTTTGPGSATLTANFSTEIGDETFTADEAQGEKVWTTFRVRVTPDEAQNLLGTPHEFTVWVEQTDDGDDWYPVEGAQPTVTTTAPGIITGTDCDTGTAEDGSCTVTINTTVAGESTLTAEYEGTIGEQSSTFSDSGTKQWVDYRVSVDPAEAENLIDTDHVFTVTVETNPGGGFVPLPGAVPTLDLDGVGEITATDCDEGTDEAGTCTVTITSDEPGLSTLNVVYVGSAGIGEQEIETADFADSGDKLWVNYLLDIDPGEAINALDDPHVFTVTLERDEGDGPFAVNGEEIDLAIEGPGTITSIVDGDVDDGDRTGTCTTDDDGTCEVTIVSGEPGTTTLTASYGAEVGETTGTFTETGTKHWAAIDLVKEALIEPDEDGIKSIVLDEGESEVVTYEYTITNIGPVPLDISSLVDDVLGTVDLPADLRLEPGESTTVTAIDTIDADAVSVTNTGLVTGIADDGTEVTDTDVETVFVTEVAPVVLEPGISVDKSVVSGTTTDADGNETVALVEGDTATIGYEFLVTNTGDDVLVDLTLVDDKIGDLSEELREAAIAEYGVAALPIGGSVVVSATYETTAADFAAGLVTNVVDVGAVGSDSRTPVTDTDEATVLISEVEVLAEVQERPLPRTGVDALQLFLLGLLTAMLGLAALLGTRRRRQE